MRLHHWDSVALKDKALNGADITVGSNHVEYANGATIHLCGDTSDGTIAFALDALARGSNAIVIPREAVGL